MKHYSPDRNYACRISTNYTYRGHAVAILENELIRIGVLLTKGTDIYEFLYKPLDIDFMWRTPWGSVHPTRWQPRPLMKWQPGLIITRVDGRKSCPMAGIHLG